MDCSLLGSSMGFSRQEYWSELPFSSPGDLPDTDIEPTSLESPALAGRFFTTSATWEAQCNRAGGLSEEVIKEGLSGRCHRRSETQKELAA